jgi:hypothetical protein
MGVSGLLQVGHGLDVPVGDHMTPREAFAAPPAGVEQG